MRAKPFPCRAETRVCGTERGGGGYMRGRVRVGSPSCTFRNLHDRLLQSSRKTLFSTPTPQSPRGLSPSLCPLSHPSNVARGGWARQKKSRSLFIVWGALGKGCCVGCTTTPWRESCCCPCLPATRARRMSSFASRVRSSLASRRRLRCCCRCRRCCPRFLSFANASRAQNFLNNILASREGRVIPPGERGPHAPRSQAAGLGSACLRLGLKFAHLSR